MGNGPYSALLARLKHMLEVSGCTEEDFESIAAETSSVAEGVFRSPLQIIADGKADSLNSATDLMLIGAIVARYGMVMGNPFAGKE